MKRLQSAPPSLPIPPPDRMLRNVSWLRNDEDLMEYIKVKRACKYVILLVNLPVKVSN